MEAAGDMTTPLAQPTPITWGSELPTPIIHRIKVNRIIMTWGGGGGGCPTEQVGDDVVQVSHGVDTGTDGVLIRLDV